MSYPRGCFCFAAKITRAPTAYISAGHVSLFLTDHTLLTQDASSRGKKESSAAGQRNGGGADSSGSGAGGAGAPPGMEKTNSWYWRRMSRAAAQDGKDGGSADGTGKDKVDIVQLSPPLGKFATWRLLHIGHGFWSREALFFSSLEHDSILSVFWRHCSETTCDRILR